MSKMKKEFVKKAEYTNNLIDSYIKILDAVDENPMDYEEKIIDWIYQEDFFIFLSILLGELKNIHNDCIQFYMDLDEDEIYESFLKRIYQWEA